MVVNLFCGHEIVTIVFIGNYYILTEKSVKLDTQEPEYRDDILFFKLGMTHKDLKQSLRSSQKVYKINLFLPASFWSGMLRERK